MGNKYIVFAAISIAMLQFNSLNAQWDTITSFNQSISDIKVFDNKLFIVGGFTKNQVTNTCYWSAYYDGSIINRHTTQIGGSGIDMICEFNGELYSADALLHSTVMGVSVWNGSSWDAASSTSNNHYMVYADGNDLYAASSAGLIKKTGTGSFQTVNLGTGVSVSRICRYNGNLVFAGSFSAINGVTANNIAMFDGTNWQPLGSGISTGVYCMAVYNNELYVAGKISTAGGNSVNNIAKWNGTTWSAVGGGTGSCPNGIRDMMVYDNGLYVVGDFTQMGGVTTGNVALWKNSSWTGLGLTHNDFYVKCIEVFNNKIYVGTAEFTKSHLFRYNGNTELPEASLASINVFPNPVSDQISIELSGYYDNTEVTVFDIEGKEIIRIPVNGNNFTIDANDWHSGVYYIKLTNNNTSVVKKIVKE